MGDSVQRISKDEINSLTPPLIHLASHLTAEGCQVDQALFPLHKPTLSAPKYLIVLHVFGNGFQGYLLHVLPRNHGEADGPIMSGIILLAFVIDLLAACRSLP